MKIAVISPWTISDTAVGGTERFTIDIAESFYNLGNEVDVYMLSGKSYKKNNINYINIKILGNNDFTDEEKLKNMFGKFSKEEDYTKIANILEKLIDISKYDLVQLNSQLFLKAFKSKMRIFTIHTNPFEFSMNFGKASFNCMLNIMKQEYNEKTCYVTPSEYYKTIYEELTNIKMNFIPHAIKTNRVNKKINIDDVYNKYPIERSLKHILLPSRLEPIQKQPMLFMNAFSKIDIKLRNKFQVICTGLDEQYMEYTTDIQKFCKENNINLKILRFDYMYEAYLIADLVVLPSKSESFGYSALESLCLGIPTILNAIPSYVEISKESNNSYIFKEKEESLIVELNKVLNSDLKRKKQNSIWLKRYDLNTFGEKYLKLINKKTNNKMDNILIYKPYENWKSFHICERNKRHFLKMYEYMLELDLNNYIPKAGLLFEEILKDKCANKKVLDLCCGQLGILGIIALHYGAKSVISLDEDSKCINWLKKLIIENKINTMKALESNLFSKIETNEKFDLILSNPPHMPMKRGKMCDSGGKDGKTYIKKILKESWNYLSDNGELDMMMFDFLGVNKSYNDDISIFEYAKKIGYRNTEIIFSFDKYIKEGSITFECLNYIRQIYPKYEFDEINPKCKICIVSFQK